MDSIKKVITINGISYNSVDDLPPEIKNAYQNLEKTFTNSFQKEQLVTAIETASPGLNYFLYFLSQIFSLTESQSLFMVSRYLFKLPSNFLISLVSSLIIGHISYLLAIKSSSKTSKQNNSGFLNKFLISQTSATFSFGLNILFMFCYYLVTKHII